MISMMNLSGCIVLPPIVAKIFQIRKIQRFDKFDSYFRFDHRVFSSRSKLWEIIFYTIYISMINFIFCTVLPMGASKVYQTRKFVDFQNLIQLFLIKAYSVLIEIEVVRSYVINNFDYHDQLLNMHRFLTRSL